MKTNVVIVVLIVLVVLKKVKKSILKNESIYDL